MRLKRILLIAYACFMLQSYCSEQPNAPTGNVLFGPNGEITGVATLEQATATGALIQKLWDMSCENLSCNDCPRCVGKRFALATKLKSQAQIDSLRQRLSSFLSKAQSATSSHAS